MDLTIFEVAGIHEHPIHCQFRKTSSARRRHSPQYSEGKHGQPHRNAAQGGSSHQKSIKICLSDCFVLCGAYQMIEGRRIARNSS